MMAIWRIDKQGVYNYIIRGDLQGGYCSNLGEVMKT